MDIVKFISDNWQILISAPLAFVSFAIIALSISFFFVQYIYKERIETLKEKLCMKDDQINDYIQRCHLADTNKTSYSKLTNRELKSKASNLIYQMREFLSIKAKEENEYHSYISRKFWQAKSNEERDKIVSVAIPSSITSKSAINIEYGKKYQTDVILQRDEFLLRLPKDYKNNGAYNFYLYLSNSFGLKMVIDDLERLSKSLPD
jgi:hypothetical protein